MVTQAFPHAPLTPPVPLLPSCSCHHGQNRAVTSLSGSSSTARGTELPTDPLPQTCPMAPAMPQVSPFTMELWRTAASEHRKTQLPTLWSSELMVTDSGAMSWHEEAGLIQEWWYPWASLGSMQMPSTLDTVVLMTWQGKGSFWDQQRCVGCLAQSFLAEKPLPQAKAFSEGCPTTLHWAREMTGSWSLWGQTSLDNWCLAHQGPWKHPGRESCSPAHC